MERSGQLALVTGASSGIGLELAKLCAAAGHDLVIVADEPQIHEAAAELKTTGVDVEAVETDLATEAGVDELLAVLGDREVSMLLANAGRGLGNASSTRNGPRRGASWDTNITGTLYLTHHVARRMVRRSEGRILFTGSIAGFMPGTFQAVYNGTKAFVDSFAVALRHDCPIRSDGDRTDAGADRDALLRTRRHAGYQGRTGRQGRPADVARDGFDAMMAGTDQVVSGWKKTSSRWRPPMSRPPACWPSSTARWPSPTRATTTCKSRLTESEQTTAA